MQKVLVVGIEPSKFQVNDFIEDCVKYHIQFPLDPTKGGKGVGNLVFKHGLASDMDKYTGLDLPFEANADIQTIVGNKGAQTIMTDIQPITSKAKSSPNA